MKRKIVIAGGTGFIGNAIAKYYQSIGYEVNIISRQPGAINWDNRKKIVQALGNAELLVNLAGKSVDCRYNEKNKQEILRSRIETTKILGGYLLQCARPPELWINSSTATIYRYAEDRPMTEKAGEIGNGFSVSVAKEWEKSFFDFQIPNVRQVALRIAIVLGAGGGALSPLKNLVKVGLGGKQGNGRQKFSWIHIDDLVNIVLFIQTNKEMNGIFNCSSPQPADNRTFMQELRKTMGIRFGLSLPRWILEMGAALIHTETELILKSRWVIPERLQKAGFKFSYPSLQEALINIVGEEDSKDK